MKKYIAITVLFMLATLANAQNFWTKEVKAETALITAEIAYDGYSTQTLLGRGYSEADPLARPMVLRGNAGQAAASVAGLGAALGTSYLLHRTHHDKLSKGVLRAVVVGEGANDVRQATLMQRCGQSRSTY
jgi:hypothetical protein